MEVQHWNSICRKIDNDPAAGLLNSAAAVAHGDRGAAAGTEKPVPGAGFFVLCLLFVQDTLCRRDGDKAAQDHDGKGSQPQNASGNTAPVDFVSETEHYE